MQPEKGHEEQICYESYFFSVREKARYCVQGMLMIGMISYLFYQSWIAFLLLLPLLRFYFKQKHRDCAEKRIIRLVDDFKSFLEVFSSNLQAGYSVENAIEESYKDIAVMSDREADLMLELRRMINGLRNNVDISDMICQFAQRSRVEEIIDFSGVFRTAKRSGGNMNTMIRQCSDLIHDKMEVRSEIRTVTAEKQLECRLMTYIPFGIMFYINLTTPGYFCILYHNLTGIVIMTVCLAVYLVAVYLSGRLVRIEV